MNERTARQISEMKKQTIGVEVEMNSITREKAAKIAAVKDIYLQLGVDADAKEEIVRFTRRAMDAVTGTGLRPIQTEALRRFAEKLVGRAK